MTKIDVSKIRGHQRRFFIAIYELRKVKHEQRRLTENSKTLGDMYKVSSKSLFWNSFILSIIWHRHQQAHLIFYKPLSTGKSASDCRRWTVKFRRCIYSWLKLHRCCSSQIETRTRQRSAVWVCSVSRWLRKLPMKLCRRAQIRRRRQQCNTAQRCEQNSNSATNSASPHKVI
jgi:hypothetical protein